MNLSQCVGHAGLISQEGCEVDGMTRIVFGPRMNLPPVPLASLVGQKPHVSMPRGMELPVRLNFIIPTLI